MRHPLSLLDPGGSSACWTSPIWLWWLGLLSTLLYAGLRLVEPGTGELAGTLMALSGLFAVPRWGRGIQNGGALWLDVLIAFKTLKTIVTGDGAR